MEAVKETTEDTTTTTTQTPMSLSDEQAMQMYLNDPAAKANHLSMAQQLQQLFQQRWFSIDMVAKKSMLKDKKAIAQMMIGLQLFKLCVSQDGGKNFKHQTKFKITIAPEDRLKVLEQYKENHLKQIESLDQEIEKVKQEISQQ